MSEPDTFPASPAPTGPELRKASTLIGAGLAGGVSERLAMKTNQHTPGPWKIHWPEEFYQQTPKHADFQIEFGPGDWGGFGVVEHAGIDRTKPGTAWTAARADAALIAAAPSLLEACKSALERIDGMNEAMGVVDELRRAITLAEGGTH